LRLPRCFATIKTVSCEGHHFGLGNMAMAGLTQEKRRNGGLSHAFERNDQCFSLWFRETRGVNKVKSRNRLLITVLTVATLMIVGGLCAVGYLLHSVAPFGGGSIGFSQKEYADLKARYGKAVEELKASSEGKQKRAQEELAAKWSAIPDGAIVSREWDLNQTLANTWSPVEEEILAVLLSYSGEYGKPGVLSDKAIEALAGRLGPMGAAGNLTPFLARFDPTGRSREEVEEQFREYVLEAPFLNEIEAAIDLGVCYSNLPPTNDVEESYRAIRRQNNAYTLLACRVIARAQRGDEAGCRETLLRMCSLARASEREPTTILLPLGVGACFGVKDLIRASLFANGKGLLDSDTRQVILDRARSSIADEEIAALFHLAAIANNGPMPVLHSTKPDGRGSELACYRLMVIADEYAGLLGQPYYAVAGRASAIELEHTPPYLRRGSSSHAGSKFVRRVRALLNQASRLVSDDTGVNEVTFCHRLDYSLQRHAEDILVGEVAGIAFALSDYKLANGTYPESLEALVPGVIATIPMDQVSGQTIVYRRTEEGYEIRVPSRHGEQEEEVFWRVYE